MLHYLTLKVNSQLKVNSISHRETSHILYVKVHIITSVDKKAFKQELITKLVLNIHHHINLLQYAN